MEAKTVSLTCNKAKRKRGRGNNLPNNSMNSTNSQTLKQQQLAGWVFFYTQAENTDLILKLTFPRLICLLFRTYLRPDSDFLISFFLKRYKQIFPLHHLQLNKEIQYYGPISKKQQAM